MPAGYLSSQETADLLGVCLSSVLKWIARGDLPAERIGGKSWLIREADALGMKRRTSKGGRPPRKSEAVR